MIYSFTLPLQLLDPPPPHVASFPSYESGGGARSLGHLQLLNDFSQWVTADAERGIQSGFLPFMEERALSSCCNSFLRPRHYLAADETSKSRPCCSEENKARILLALSSFFCQQAHWTEKGMKQESSMYLYLVPRSL